MSSFTLDQLPECMLLRIFELCDAEDLSHLSQTCVSFWNIVSSDVLWKKLCQRELQQTAVDLGNFSSYYKLYTSLLHEYKSIIGVYQTECGYYGILLEVKFEDGSIVGTVMEGTSEPGKIFQELVKEIQFKIRGDSSEALEHICLPEIDPHPFTMIVDPATSKLSYSCSRPRVHMKLLLAKFVIEAKEMSRYAKQGAKKERLQCLKKHMFKSKPIISWPLTMPSPEDVPRYLRNKEGGIPSQVITPGLFAGDYSTHGVELILFKYVSDNELHGFKVTGDSNIPAGKISIKCFLDYPVNPTQEEQSSMEALIEIPKVKRTVKVHELPQQRFILPDTYEDDVFSSSVHAPQMCHARYHGECQIADTDYKDPSFTPAHVIIFNDDLIAITVMELYSLFVFKRCPISFPLQYRRDVKSVF